MVIGISPRVGDFLTVRASSHALGAPVPGMRKRLPDRLMRGSWRGGPPAGFTTVGRLRAAGSARARRLPGRHGHPAARPGVLATPVTVLAVPVTVLATPVGVLAVPGGSLARAQPGSGGNVWSLLGRLAEKPLFVALKGQFRARSGQHEGRSVVGRCGSGVGRCARNAAIRRRSPPRPSLAGSRFRPRLSQLLQAKSRLQPPYAPYMTHDVLNGAYGGSRPGRPTPVRWMCRALFQAHHVAGHRLSETDPPKPEMNTPERPIQ